MKHILIALLLVGASLVPSAAFAQPAAPYPYRVLPVQCAVGYTAGPERVAMVMASVNDQEFVDTQAAMCTNFITQGSWTGIDNQGSWRPSMRLVAIVQPLSTGNMTINVWATPDYPSIGLATGIAQVFGQTGNYQISYF